MAVAAPHFLLRTQSRARNRTGDWRFVLQGATGEKLLEVEEAESAIGGDRLELLAVVRGLEALDQPSQITLLTGSAYVSRGLKYGLDDWRSNNWQWESHGRMVPMKNGRPLASARSNAALPSCALPNTNASMRRMIPKAEDAHFSPEPSGKFSREPPGEP